MTTIRLHLQVPDDDMTRPPWWVAERLRDVAEQLGGTVEAMTADPPDDEFAIELESAEWAGPQP